MNYLALFLIFPTLSFAIVGGIKDTRKGVCRIDKNASSSPSQECTASKVAIDGKNAQFVLAAHCFAHDALGLILKDQSVGEIESQVMKKDWSITCPASDGKSPTQKFRFNGNAIVNSKYLTELSKIKQTVDNNFEKEFTDIKDDKLSKKDKEILVKIKNVMDKPSSKVALKKCLIAAYFGKQNYNGNNYCPSPTGELAKQISESKFFTSRLANLVKSFLNPDAIGTDTAILNATYTGEGNQDRTVINVASSPEEVSKFISNSGPQLNTICRSYGYGSTRYTNYGQKNDAGAGKSLLIDRSNFMFLSAGEKNKSEEMVSKNTYVDLKYGDKDSANNLTYAQDDQGYKNYALTFSMENQSYRQFKKETILANKKKKHVVRWKDDFESSQKLQGSSEDAFKKLDQVDMSHNSLAPGDSGGPLICESFKDDCVYNCKKLLGKFSMYSTSDYQFHPLANSFSNRLFEQCVRSGTIDVDIYEKIKKETIAQAHHDNPRNDGKYLGAPVDFGLQSIHVMTENETKTDVDYSAAPPQKNVEAIRKFFSGKQCESNNDSTIVGLNQSIMTRGANNFAILGNDLLKQQMHLTQECNPKGDVFDKILESSTFSDSTKLDATKKVVQDCMCKQSMYIMQKLINQRNSENRIDIQLANQGFNYNWEQFLDDKTLQSSSLAKPRKNSKKESEELKDILMSINYCQAESGRAISRLQPYIKKVAFYCKVNTDSKFFACDGDGTNQTITPSVIKE